ncbi:glutaredoxin domain-containing protein [Streptomyces sp. SP18ES09]|uniref:glutaredoxin domain-containing protein n=1 Tax=Streptomyces sp. SP18ES09 TaxID=3002532 RepID=UPI002E7724F9|nr:glutaredoxin domain-containing protein [Streptomyces sp. SP18ES09]MEE1820400.1 glutaredoxin domain-containing protein [Streptomyces sp. SP18ES09]
MMRVWILPLLFAVAGVLVAVGMIAQGSPVEGAVLLVLFLLLASLNSPLIFPRSISAEEAGRRGAADGRPVVYWRPGCPFCIRLRIGLGRGARRAHWVNIWRDPEGAAAVRAVNDGDETVPTVFVGGRPHTNPDPAWVRERLSPTA